MTTDLRNACKLIIGRQRDIPWRDVPDSDVDGYVDKVRKLDPPMPQSLVERLAKWWTDIDRGPAAVCMRQRCLNVAARFVSDREDSSADVWNDAVGEFDQLIADLQRYSDPVPGVTREQNISDEKAGHLAKLLIDMGVWDWVRIKAILLRELGERSVAEDPHPQYTKDTGFSPECEV